MSDTKLYPVDPPGWYAADFGGVSVQVDTDRRVIQVHVSVDDATDYDFDLAGECLSRLGIADCDRVRMIEEGLFELEADF